MRTDSQGKQDKQVTAFFYEALVALNNPALTTSQLVGLNMSQCNNAYSAVKIAQALANAFECGVNDLPLSIIPSWYEQKAVVILLSLLSLGIKRMRIDPSLPAFLSSNILGFLVTEFDLKPISTAKEDLAAILG